MLDEWPEKIDGAKYVSILLKNQQLRISVHCSVLLSSFLTLHVIDFFLKTRIQTNFKITSEESLIYSKRNFHIK